MNYVTTAGSDKYLVSPNHTAITTTAKGVVDAIQVPTLSPGSSDVLVKIEYATLSPVDTYIVDLGFLVQSYPTTLGFSASGTVVKAGDGVKGLVIGDQVAGFAISSPDGRALQQYAVFPANLCAKIPASVDLAAAATISDNFVTAFFTLFGRLSLPIPTAFPATTPPPDANTPILIYGCGSTVGIYAVQLLKLAGYTKILTTASKRHHEYLSQLGASHNFDYGSPTLADDIISAIDGHVPLVVNCISTIKTLAAISKFIDKNGKLAILVPVKDSDGLTGGQMWTELPSDLSPFTPDIELIYVETFMFQQNEYMKDNLMSSVLPSLLKSSSLHPNKVILLDKKDGSLKERTEKGIEKLRKGEIRGEKLVVKVDH